MTRARSTIVSTADTVKVNGTAVNYFLKNNYRSRHPFSVSKYLGHSSINASASILLP
jgi:hypothetical protein